MLEYSGFTLEVLNCPNFIQFTEDVLYKIIQAVLKVILFMMFLVETVIDHACYIVE